MEAAWNDVQFTDADVVNPDDYFANVGCGNNKPWLVHDHGFTLAVVFAENEQDALDIAADNDKLDGFLLNPEEKSVRDAYMAPADVQSSDYGSDANGGWRWRDDKGVSFLGNCGHPFDIESVSVVELPNPKFSFATLFDAL